MFVTHEREKLINAIIYFVRKTKRCHKLKLFKLLSFLDFEHYRQTGRTVTGLSYDAWPMGPVPSELDEELDAPKPDLTQAIGIFRERDDGRVERTIDDFSRLEMEPQQEEAFRHAIDQYVFKPKKRFNDKYFTKREMKIMGTLAEIFQEALGDDMKDVSHLKGLPWREVFGLGEGNGRPIPFELALASDPFIHDIPTIDNDERDYREEALREVRLHEKA